MNKPDERFGVDLYSPTGPEFRPEWDMRLVVDMALGTSTESILDAHNLQHHQFEKILQDPGFVAQVAAMKKSLEKEGATFRLKSQIQADYYLSVAHAMIMDPQCDERVRTRLIEDVVRWGGLDAPASVGGGSVGGFNITINFGQHERRGITLEAERD